MCISTYTHRRANIYMTTLLQNVLLNLCLFWLLFYLLLERERNINLLFHLIYAFIGRFFFKKYFIYLFSERGEGKKKEQERNINVWLHLAPLGTWLATQACALTGNQTGDPLICRPTLNHWAIPGRAIYRFLHVPWLGIEPATLELSGRCFNQLK